MAVSTLTSIQKRFLRDYIPALSDRAPGIDLYAILASIIADGNAIVSGSGDITGVATTLVVAVGAAFDAKPVTASVMVVDGSATDGIASATWDGSGNLTITLNTAPGGSDTATVAYIVDGR